MSRKHHLLRLKSLFGLYLLTKAILSLASKHCQHVTKIPSPISISHSCPGVNFYTLQAADQQRPRWTHFMGNANHKYTTPIKAVMVIALHWSGGCQLSCSGLNPAPLQAASQLFYQHSCSPHGCAVIRKALTVTLWSVGTARKGIGALLEQECGQPHSSHLLPGCPLGHSKICRMWIVSQPCFGFD